VFTVRSKGQIGKFPDDEPERMFSLLREGLRAGCEWIDVEACWGDERIGALTQTADRDYASTSRILGSLHVTTPQTESQIQDLFEQTKLRGSAHMLKVLLVFST
jgi:3-dehydroquinate dehydratase